MKKLLLLLIPFTLFSQNVTRDWSDTNLTVQNVTVNGTISGFAELEFDNVAQMLAFDFSQTADGSRVMCNGYVSTNDDSFGPDLYWNATSTATADGVSIFDPAIAGNGRLIRTLPHQVKAEWAGAVANDGLESTHDDSPAIQSILDLNRIAVLERGQYAISTQLSLKRSSGIIGQNLSYYPDTVQTGTGLEQNQSAWGTQESILKWIGGTGSTTCVIFAATAALGTQPTSNFQDNIYGVILKDFIIDGDGGNGSVGAANADDGDADAAYGIYAARPQDWLVDNVTVTKTDLHAFYFNGVFSGRFSKLTAVFNDGAGISFGRAIDDFTWTANYQINGAYLEDLYASGNGQDEDFDESSNADGGYGIGLNLHRGNVVDGWVSENNDGVGLYYSPTSGPNYVQNGYVELNNYWNDSGGNDAVDDGRASQGWGIWFHGQTGGGNASVHSSIQNCFFQGGSSAQGIRLTGTEPSNSRPEGGIEFEQIYPSASFVDATPGPAFLPLFADWDNFRLVDSAQELVDGTFTPLTTEGNITASAAALSDTTNDPFTRPMVGKYVIIEGAGTAGANHISDISVLTDRENVTITDNAATTVSTNTIWLQGYFPNGHKVIPNGIGFDTGEDALDGYVEDSWTPVLYGASTPGSNTYSLQLGRYTQVGNTIHAYGKIVLTAKDGAMAGSVRISGLPRKATIVGNRQSGGSVQSYANMGSATGTLTTRVDEDTDYIMIFKHDTLTTSTEIVPADIAATTEIVFNVIYETDE